MTVAIIEESNVQAKPIFSTLAERKTKKRCAWDRAMAEGAVTVKAFTNELRARIEKWPDDYA